MLLLIGSYWNLCWSMFVLQQHPPSPCSAHLIHSLINTVATIQLWCQKGCPIHAFILILDVVIPPGLTESAAATVLTPGKGSLLPWSGTEDAPLVEAQL